MKKIYLMILVSIASILFALPGFAESEMQVSRSRFSCDSFYTESASLFSQADGSVIVSFRNGAPDLRLVGSSFSGAEGCNAVRVVLKNNSACNELVLSYTKDGEEVEAFLSIDRRSGNTDYYFYIDEPETIADLKLSFSGAHSGTVELYSVGAVSMYNDVATSPGNILECVYDSKAREIRISGTVDHEFAINTRSAAVELYAFGMDETVTKLKINNASPIAKAALSIRFEFKVQEAFFTDRFLQYVVAIMGEDGRVLYYYTPKCPSIEGGIDAENEIPFKGVYTDHTVLATWADAGVAVVDVDLNRLKSEKNNGLVQIVDGRYFYINRDYIYELDSTIKQYSANGCSVYLRFLLSDDGGYSVLHSSSATSSEAEYYGIELTSDIARLTLCAYTEFLCERFSGQRNGSVTGIVVGRSVDYAAKYNYTGEHTLAEYTRIYGNVLYIISQAARDTGRGVDIVVPVTDLNDDGSLGRVTKGRYLPELFLTSLSKMMSSRFGGGLAVRVMLESSEIPSGLLGTEVNKRAVSAENISGFEALLKSLASSYGRIKSRYLYYWMPQEFAEKEILEDAYIYTYYKLKMGNAASLIVSTEELDDAIDPVSLFEKMKYADTQLGQKIADKTLSAFGQSEWSALIPGFMPSSMIQRYTFIYDSPLEMPTNLRGSAVLWDTNQGRSLSGWYVGAENSVSVKNVTGYGKALVAELSPTGESEGYSSLVYSFVAKDIMEWVDALSIDILIDGDLETDYHLIFEVCGEKSSCEVSATVKGWQAQTIYLDTLDLGRGDNIRCVRVFSAPSDGDEQYRFCLRKITAYSTVLNDSELEKEVADSRFFSPTDKDVSTDNDFVRNVAAISVVFVLCASAFVLIALAKRGENGRDT